VSAGTQISPAGFYLFDEEDDEQAKLRGLVQQNPDFEPLTVRDLVDASLSSWVHHVLYILPQVVIIFMLAVHSYDSNIG